MMLYHYTTAEGLEGIVKSKSIWASDYRFVNDATELRYGLSIFEKIFKGLSTQYPRDVIDIVEKFSANVIPDFSLLIASFCERGDLLSQWRGYNGGLGYAVGMNGDWLTQNAEAQGFRLFPVCYESARQEKVIADRISLLRHFIEKEKMGPNPNWHAVVNNWWQLMLLTIAAVKNEHFKEECEYRLVQTRDGWPQGICTRSTRSGLIPYLPMRLDAKIIDHPLFDPRNIGIEQIVLGPGLRDQQKIAIEALLASQHMRFEVKKSAIPYIPP